MSSRNYVSGNNSDSITMITGLLHFPVIPRYLPQNFLTDLVGRLACSLRLIASLATVHSVLCIFFMQYLTKCLFSSSPAICFCHECHDYFLSLITWTNQSLPVKD